MIVIATAGWSIPRACAGRFPGDGTHLRRYARVLRGAEIDTSFYRDHVSETYAGWARQTPRAFSFAVKLPRQITHDGRLRAARRALTEFIRNVAGLGHRLGPLVAQLPPSLPFEARVAQNFFALLRDRFDGLVVCEPRHPSWFAARPDALLKRFRVGRVAADPAVVPDAALPGGSPEIVYFRLHGSPRKYWSIYEEARLGEWLAVLKSLPRGMPAWCVLDNTASGGAAFNALQMLDAQRRAWRQMG
jgi:uncharacterized protein YecE (DUF72 family)